MIVCIIGVCSFEDRSTLRAAARAVLCIAPVPLSILPGPTTKYQLPNLTRPYNVLARWPATGAAPAALRCNLGVSEIKPFRATLPVPRRPCCRHQVQLNHASAREPVAGSSGRLVVWSSGRLVVWSSGRSGFGFGIDSSLLLSPCGNSRSQNRLTWTFEPIRYSIHVNATPPYGRIPLPVLLWP